MEFNIDRHTGRLVNLGLRAPSEAHHVCLVGAAKSVRFEALPEASCDPRWLLMPMDDTTIGLAGER